MPKQQQNLFNTEPEPWEADDQAEMLVATVVFTTGPAQEFDYLVPDALREQIDVGKRVRVPLGRGNRPVEGYCVRLEPRRTNRRLKPVKAVLDQRGLLSPAMLRLTQWIADHYLCSWATVLEAVLPAGVRSQAGTRLTTFLTVDAALAGQVSNLSDLAVGQAPNLPIPFPPAPPSPNSASTPPKPPPKLSKKQLSILRTLASAGGPLTPAELARAAKCTLGPIHTLRRLGLIRAQATRVQSPLKAPAPAERQPHLKLNDDQRRALDAILAALHSRQHQTLLMHGVTGSGKTEVYIQAIQEVLRFGRQAIVLVPEISLTPQTVERFRSRFGEVAVLHSHLSDAERHRHWQQIADGAVPVIVGARSAVFAPTPHLGLIVIDEEHETSFKQETAPRYHARDVAQARAKAEGVPLVLGSATPALESWHRAQGGEYRLVSLPRRVMDRPLPNVGTIDLRSDKYRSESRGSISRQLHAAMGSALDAGGQVILLLNRRGFSTHIQCQACGHVVRCPHCDIALTHHRTEQIALCHYCDFEVPAPAACPECQFTGVRYSGLGTQRLEAEVHARFPGVPCVRMDTDAMRGHGAYERALGAFRSGQVRILLGTQMIAKGLDFPDVTLVGVINADTALHLPDFRAAERTFHLVTQVAGRTGRGPKGGRVLVQTFNPEHPAIQAAARHDYAAFARNELPIREMLRYPPFTEMVRCVVRGPKERVTADFAAHLGERLRAALAAAPQAKPDARVLGPAPAPFARLRGKYRFQIQLQGDGEALRAAARAATADLELPDDVQWIVDVDPLDML